MVSKILLYIIEDKAILLASYENLEGANPKRFFIEKLSWISIFLYYESVNKSNKSAGP